MLAGIYEILQTFGENAVQWLREEHEKAGQVASGKTLESFRFELIEENEVFKVQIIGANNVQWLDTGRGSGKLPANWHEIMTKWVQDKGISGQFRTQQQLNSFIYLVGRKTKNEGNLQHRTGRTFLGGVKPISEAFKDENMKELNRLLNKYISSRIKSEIVEQYGNA